MFLPAILIIGFPGVTHSDERSCMYCGGFSRADSPLVPVWDIRFSLTPAPWEAPSPCLLASSASSKLEPADHPVLGQVAGLPVAGHFQQARLVAENGDTPPSWCLAGCGGEMATIVTQAARRPRT